MGRTLLAASWLLALCLCVPALAAEAPPSPSPSPITEVSVSGTSLLSESFVLDALGVRLGQPFDLERLQAAAERYNAAGLYGTVGYKFDPVEGGVQVHVSVSERVRLTAVGFRGNERFSARRLEELTGLSAGSQVTPAEVRRAERLISDTYRDEGYPRVAVHGRLSRVGPDARVLTFQISEGARTWVERVEFSGNEHVPANELQKVMESKTRKWLKWIWPGWFDDIVFSGDLTALQHAYRERGFLDAQVEGRPAFSEDGSRVVLQVSVQEGPLYRLREVSFEGNTLFRSDELLAQLPLDVGEPYNPGQVDAALKRISTLYANQGYWDVTAASGNLQVQEVLPQEGTDVALRFRIVEGEPVYIGRIQIRGLTKTKEAVVRRELTFYPGERASRAKFRESEHSLLNAGYFDRTAPRPVDISLAPSEGAVRDAIVRVNEGSTGRLMLTGGIGSDAGVMGGLMIEEDNFDFWNWPSSWADVWYGNAFRGAGQKLAISLNAGTERSYYSITFENPAVWNSEYSFGTSLYSRGIVRQVFDETRTGLSLTAGERLSKFARRSITVGYESVHVDNLPTPAPPQLLSERGSHSKPFVRVEGSVDRRDDRYMPSEGYYRAGTIELAAGDVGAVKLDARGEKYWTVRQERERRKHVVGLRGEVGTILGDPPAWERFYAGGFRSLRGFDFEGVSPSHSATGVLVGGKSMVVGSAEYSFPATESDTVRLVGFCDAGTVRDSSLGLLFPLSELRLTLGLGVRLSVPALGPTAVEFDLAAPLMKQPDDVTQFFHFSMAAQW